MRSAGGLVSMAGLFLLASPAHAQSAPQNPATEVEAGKPVDPVPDDQSSGPAAQASPSDEAPGPAAAEPAPSSDESAAPDVPSTEAWQVINWVIATHDNNDLPFMVIDKTNAEVFLFDASGEKIAAAPALVGMTKGDESTPGVGDRELSNIPPKDRKTPAGRFVAKFGRAAGGRDVLWVDYPSAISLHPVVTIRNQHRLERLKSPTPHDNRITYGCINVPTSFYAKIVRPLFKKTSGIVYVLPETKPLNDVFLAMPMQPESPAVTQTAE